MSNKRVKPKYQQLLEFIFYGNYFYGICAIALSVAEYSSVCITDNGNMVF